MLISFLSASGSISLTSGWLPSVIRAQLTHRPRSSVFLPLQARGKGMRGAASRWSWPNATSPVVFGARQYRQNPLEHFLIDYFPDLERYFFDGSRRIDEAKPPGFRPCYFEKPGAHFVMKFELLSLKPVLVTLAHCALTAGGSR